MAAATSKRKLCRYSTTTVFSRASILKLLSIALMSLAMLILRSVSDDVKMAVEYTSGNERLSNDSTLSVNASFSLLRSTGLSISKQKFILNNVHICDPVDYDGFVDQTKALLPVFIIVVHSRPDQLGRAQRDAIRGTWGSISSRLPGVRLVFILGQSSTRSKDDAATSTSGLDKLERESKLYNDLVVATDLIDSYQNLTLKSLAGMRWAKQHCPAANYFLKADDDVYLRTDLLPEVFLSVEDDKKSTAAIVGSLNVNASVHRSGLWNVDRRLFPGDQFPPYCSGNVYAMTSSAVDQLLATADREPESTEPTFPLEDVYVTAILASRSGLRCQHDKRFPHWVVGPTGNNLQRMREGGLLAVHNVHYTRMYDIHSKWQRSHGEKNRR